MPVVVFDAVSDVEAASAAPPSPLHSVSSSLGFVLNELFPVENVSLAKLLLIKYLPIFF